MQKVRLLHFVKICIHNTTQVSGVQGDCEVAFCKRIWCLVARLGLFTVSDVRGVSKMTLQIGYNGNIPY